MPLEVRMIELYRLAGSILIKSKNQFYLLGNLKEPCNLNQYGFEQVDFDALQIPYLKLNIYDESKTIFFRDPIFILSNSELRDIEAILQNLSDKLLIKRNGSVSERLWNLLKNYQKDKNISWIIDIPQEIWDIVRDNVLKCT